MLLETTVKELENTLLENLNLLDFCILQSLARKLWSNSLTKLPTKSIAAKNNNNIDVTFKNYDSYILNQMAQPFIKSNGQFDQELKQKVSALHLKLI